MVLKISIGAITAFCMEVSEFLVLSHTSSLTLSVVGILKEICQLVLAVETKGDQLSFINIVGLIVCLAGIFCHVLNKYNVYARQNDQQLRNSHLAAGDGNGESGGSASSNDFNVSYKAARGQGTTPLLERSSLMDSEDDDDVSLFDANGKRKEQSSNDILYDIVQRRDQRR